jgi:hypothetical protein
MAQPAGLRDYIDRFLLNSYLFATALCVCSGRKLRPSEFLACGCRMFSSTLYQIPTMTLPPQTGKKAPVIKPACSDAKKVTACAMSVSAPRRRNGTADA